MSDGSAVIWAAGISALGALVLSILTALRVRKKDDAEANAITSVEWMRLYDKQEEKLHYIESQIDTLRHIESGLIDRVRNLENELASTKRSLERTAMALEVAEANIKYLLEYMKSKGLEIPDLKFRG